MFNDLWLHPSFADEHGLVAVGGDLRPERLLRAYRRGIFPWFGAEDPVLWWSPDPRAIFEIGGLHISRRLLRTIRSQRFELTINRDFPGVIRGCACRAGDRPEDGVWITREMIAAYEALHRLGHAHSVEAWHNGALAGGIYGVAVGGFFAGESMFTRIRDASKIALSHLMEQLQTRGFLLFDVQFLTAHTQRLGAVEIPRLEYLERLRRAVAARVSFV